MIRNFFSIGFLVVSMGLPLLAKNAGIDLLAPASSSKAGSKSIPASIPGSASAIAKAKEQISPMPIVTLTEDISRNSVSPSLAAKQEALVAKQELLTAKQEIPISKRNVLAAKQEASAAPIQTSPHDMQRSGALLTSSINRASASTSATMTCGEAVPLRTAAAPISTDAESSSSVLAGGRLARVTAYWAAEGDYYTERCISSTGVRLHDGHCAVDPTIIPYGSVVEIAGVGKFLAVDTGSAVISRTAAKEGGHTPAERHAIVIDLFFEDRSEGEKFAAGAAKYVAISWWTPSSMGIEARAARGLFAEEDWTKIQGKQL
jgi:3D (Asp-Asp-Asp) domain-containing protein